MTKEQLVALRLYTSHSFPAINNPLRMRHQPYPLPAIVMCMSSGLKRLDALDATSDQATAKIEFFRGFTDIQVTDDFKRRGGTEFAPMSTTTDFKVACGYAVRKGKTNGALLMKIVTENNKQRGKDMRCFSMFPGEAEALFPPLTFMQPTQPYQTASPVNTKLSLARQSFCQLRVLQHRAQISAMPNWFEIVFPRFHYPSHSFCEYVLRASSHVLRVLLST